MVYWQTENNVDYSYNPNQSVVRLIWSSLSKETVAIRVDIRRGTESSYNMSTETLRLLSDDFSLLIFFELLLELFDPLLHPEHLCAVILVTLSLHKVIVDFMQEKITRNEALSRENKVSIS